MPTDLPEVNQLPLSGSKCGFHQADRAACPLLWVGVSFTLRGMGAVLVSWSCYNKGPQTGVEGGALKQQKRIFSVLEASSLKSWCGQSCVPSQGSREGLFSVSGFWRLHGVLVSASVVTRYSSCVSSPISYKDNWI